MEANEQTELTSRIETDSQVESRMTASEWRGKEGRRVEGLSKKDSLTWTTVRRLLWGGGIRGLKGNEKKTTKIN